MPIASLAAAPPLALATHWWLLLLLVVAIPAIFVLGVWLAPRGFVWLFFWVFTKLSYRVDVHGLENLPREGPVLLTPNHVSWLDGFLVQLLTPRHLCTLVYAGNFRAGWVQRLAHVWKAVLIDAGPKSIVRALRTARNYLNEGEVVCIFPEGGISRNGQLQSFKAGMLKVLEGTEACVVPAYIHGLWGSIFSFSGGKFFWKIPKFGRRKVDIYFGAPLHHVADVYQVRQAVADLGAQAMQESHQPMTSVSTSLIRGCKKRLFRSKMADSAGTDVTGGAALMRALILRRALRRLVLSSDEQHVGVLLPPSVGGALTNMALVLDRRVPVNLNYTVSDRVLNECTDIAGIRHVLTTRKVLEKLNLKLDAEVVYLEDLKPQITLLDKLVGAVSAYALPASFLQRQLGLHEIQPDDVLTVIFTSGSTGTPKGVMLTYENVASNIRAIDQVIRLDPQDVIVGILPFFHSMGFTVTLWCVGALDIKGIYHFNPLDARQVSKLTQKHGGTILISTPTFLRSYLRRVDKEDFATLDTVVAGAEKLPKELCDALEETFGIRPVEGYGTTELSPLVSVNIPPSRDQQDHQKTRCEGSVGRCIPGVTARIIDVDTQEICGVDEPGLLHIKGPNVMKGYLNAPEKTAEVLNDGWYNTGDVARIDSDGFIHITGRISRFSKIGGEMVPHIKIEEILQEFVGMDEEQGPSVAVTAVPDTKKGERLIVLHTSLPHSADEMVQALKQAGLPNIFLPSADSFREIDAMPVLGTGKLDLKGIRQTALEHFAK